MKTQKQIEAMIRKTRKENAKHMANHGETDWNCIIYIDALKWVLDKESK